MSKLTNEWRVWFSYKKPQQQKSSQYTQQKVHLISTTNDLVYIWTTSNISSLTQFFIFQHESQYQTYQYEINGNMMRVNSINFFKKDIEPSWEDQANKKGGRLVFQIQKSQQNFQQIYQALVFYFLGENYENSETINGIRFISSNPNNVAKFFYRVQIWTNFDGQATEKVKAFRQSFINGFLAQYKIKNLDPRFKNNASDK